MAKARKLKSGRWNVQVYDYTDESGKKHVQSFTADTKAEAEFLAADFAAHKETIKKAPDPTVGDILDKYIALCETASPTTVDTYKKIRRFAFQPLMSVKISDLDAAKMQQAVNEEARRCVAGSSRTISPRTVKNEYGLLSAALREIAGKEFRVRLPKVQKNVEMLPDPAVVLAAIKGTEIELPCLLAMWLGLRLSEIKGLTKDSIRDGYLYIDKIMVYADGREILKDTAKTASSKRRLAVPEYILRLAAASATESDFIVPMSRNAIHHRFVRLMAARGVDMSFHDLRHLYASISLTVLGIPPKSVQISGGWATSAVMDRVYSQTFDAVQKEADERRRDFYAAQGFCTEDEKY